MPVVTIVTEMNQEGKDVLFFNKLSERLQDNNFIRNPFINDVRLLYIRNNKHVWVSTLEPIYPVYIPFFLFISSLFLIPIFNFNWVTIGLSMLALCICALWSKWAFQLFFYIGLRRNAYRQSISFYSSTKLIKEMVNNG